MTDNTPAQACPKCGRTLCPKCGAHVEAGYGIAFGGGLGSYEWCPGAVCNWYVKQHDSEDVPHIEEKATP